MAWTVEFAEAAEQDLTLIFDHLVESYQGLGDDAATAFERAVQRLSAIQTEAQGLAAAPYQGTLRPDLLDGVRFVRQDRAVVWFLPQDSRQVVQVLAVFFGGQDQIRHMLVRSLSRE